MSLWGSEAVYDGGVMAADATMDKRVAFIHRTYLHLLAAVLAFVGLEFIFFQTGIAARLAELLFSMRFG